MHISNFTLAEKVDCLGVLVINIISIHREELKKADLDTFQTLLLNLYNMKLKGQ
jgi:hypothetical protein